MDGNNLLELARKLRLERARLRTGNLIASCPFAPYRHLKSDGTYGIDKKASFGIKVVPQGESHYNCFACESRGDLMYLLLELGELRGRDYSQLEEWVFNVESLVAFNELVNVDDDDEAFMQAPTRQLQIQKRSLEVYGESELDRFRGPLPPYAYERGLTDDVCKAWEILDDPEEQRLLFPVRRRDGALVGLKGRSYANAKNKYFPYLEFDQGSFFYGEHMLTDETRTVVVVEGEFDVLKLWMAGFTPLGLMGGNVTKEQRRKLELWGYDIVIMADPNETGRKWALRLGSQMRDQVNVYDAILTGTRDPDQHTMLQLQDLVNGAKIRL